MNFAALAKIQTITARDINRAYDLYEAIDNDECCEDEQLNEWLLNATDAEIDCIYDFLCDLLDTHEEEAAA